MQKSQADAWIHRLLPVLEGALRHEMALPLRAGATRSPAASPVAVARAALARGGHPGRDAGALSGAYLLARWHGTPDSASPGCQTVTEPLQRQEETPYGEKHCRGRLETAHGLSGRDGGGQAV